MPAGKDGQEVRRDVVETRILDENLGTVLPSFGPLSNGPDRSIAPFRTSIEGPTVQGGLEIYPLRTGITMWILDLNVRKDMTFDWKISGPGVGFCVVLSGTSTHTVGSEAGGEGKVECRPGQNVIESYHTGNSHVHLSGGQTHRAVEVHIGAEHAHPLLDEWQISRSEPLRHLLVNIPEIPARLSTNVVPPVEAAAYQVINCSMEGPARGLFMESKALEILAHQFATFCEEDSSGSKEMPKADLSRLHQAREVLTAEFADPPSLIQLAHRVGFERFQAQAWLPSGLWNHGLRVRAQPPNA